MAGETGPISASLPVDMIIGGFFAVACYNCVEILISLLYRFKRHDGLYFWSMVTATVGIVLHSIVVLLRYYSLGPNFPLAVLTCIGWYGMVTGQSVVLYSRLHLIISDRAKARWVLIMIMINFCILHIPVTVLFLGSNTRESNRFLTAFNIYERVQLAGFSIQESVISGLYIWEASHGLKPIFAMKKMAARKVIQQLILVNVLVVLLDISLIITQYLDHFQIATTYKPVVYSIKLKMEFVVLNRLLLLVRHKECNCMQVVDEPSGILPRPSYLNITECWSNEQAPSSVGCNDNGIQLHPVRAADAPPRPDSRSPPRPSQFALFDADPYCRKEALSCVKSNTSTQILVSSESLTSVQPHQQSDNDSQIHLESTNAADASGQLKVARRSYWPTTSQDNVIDQDIKW
ncbi:hypothetical protein EDB80DRAFT_880024 [Ilyonectria destructans]|nr:hypothetical protein EDB80DRAFT_880024 [Ilyonectria destructans]